MLNGITESQQGVVLSGQLLAGKILEKGPQQDIISVVEVVVIFSTV